MIIVEPTPLEIMKITCYCGEEKQLFFPADERTIREQFLWMIQHLKEHKALYHESPFNIDVTVRAPPTDEESEESIEDR